MTRRERLGRYHVVRPLAAGGMGEILLAEHTGLSGFAKRVALKVIAKEFASSPAYVELFLNEARVGSFLNHPNIVHIFDVGHEDGELFLVMELVEGIDAKRLFRRTKLAAHPLPPALVIAIMVEVLAALEEAHAGGPFRSEPIIHRDLSPENILIARSGGVKVLDFGLAKWAPGKSSVPSMEGSQIFGKVRYMPPEQLRGKLIDVRADLFALGVVIYEALTGELPFGSGSANEVLKRILRGSPSRVSEGTDPHLDALVQKAIAPIPEDRYQTATEMRHALVAYLRGSNMSLPSEALRELMSPGSPAVDTASLPHDAAAFSLRLSVVERCGKCGGTVSAMYLDGLVVDQCQACHGVWMDPGETRRILGRRPVGSIHPAPLDRAPLDRLIGSCPSCRVSLKSYDVPDRPAAIEVCPLCFGVWFDKGELQLIEDDEFLTWLRILVQSLRAVAARALA
ncbi:MAG: protein kinase [Deltaproteobacteria bacterium]|nr:protein kinase [Deltaproteobacteria bacterium]